MSVMQKILLTVTTTAACVGLAVSVHALELPENDYPTEARADYVFGCMAVNGQTRDILRRCSCSIDEMAAIIPYAKYEEAETILSVVRKGGENVGALRNPRMQNKVADLRRAQVEAELLCF